jgi:hypothetical protein
VDQLGPVHEDDGAPLGADAFGHLLADALG